MMAITRAMSSRNTGKAITESILKARIWPSTRDAVWPRKTGFNIRDQLENIVRIVEESGLPQLDTTLLFKVENGTRHLGSIHQDYLINNAQITQLLLSSMSDPYQEHMGHIEYTRLLSQVMSINMYKKLKGLDGYNLPNPMSRKYLDIYMHMEKYYEEKDKARQMFIEELQRGSKNLKPSATVFDSVSSYLE